MAKTYVETPLMKQYYSIKAVHPDAILLFRVGDFYETFGEDAVRTAGILGITLTRRANGAASFVELAGIPYHALNNYLPRLVRSGARVAICEQLEDPKKVKGGNIVKRGVVELITPGVALGEELLEGKKNHFLASVFFGAKSTGVAFLDISTGEFFAAEGSDAYIDKLLSSLSPREVIFQRQMEARFVQTFGQGHCTYKLDEWVWSAELNEEKLCRHFGVASLRGFGIDELKSAVAAAGAVLYYLEFTEHRDVGHITAISRLDEAKYVWLDKFSIRNLELFSSSGRSFVEVVDHTRTSMGGRLLRRWIALPLLDAEAIGKRHDVVQFFKENAVLRGELGEVLGEVGDLERLASRIATRRALPRELVQLGRSLEAVERIGGLLTGAAPLKELAERLDYLTPVKQRLRASLFPDPCNQLPKGGYIADGVDAQLDDLRRIAGHGREVMAAIERRESDATGIPSLKVSFNNVFGYYIEVRNTHKDKVPSHWVRKQTLTGAERYITPELKEYEEKILGAEERMVAIEQGLYDELLSYLNGFLGALQRNGAVAARIDCLLSFAELAEERNYARPVIDDSHVLEIRDGRHPVIETLLPVGETYVPNDVFLDDERQQIMMITGPNMSGKSALLRQTALIVLMAQMGSFVPAAAATIGVVDKIFTRVGASDNISQGESTFMVEMLEAASILNNLSPRSLLLMDEIGRGTSTYDGISIAWSMVEFMHRHKARPKTLFATHYHELNQLADTCPRVRNYHVSVREVGRTIVFLRKLAPGGTERSFGIHVARMAGMPKWVVDRAGVLLESMGGAGVPGSVGVPAGSAAEAFVPMHEAVAAMPAAAPEIQLSMFQLDDPVLSQIRDEIKGLNIDSLSPLEALLKLSEIKKIVTGK